MSGWYNVISIFFVFPFVLLLGAGSVVKGKKSVGICRFLGDISYPVYIVHFPLIYMQTAWISNNPEAPVYAHVVLAVGIFLMSLAMAYSALKLYDIPVRKWLSDKYLKAK